MKMNDELSNKPGDVMSDNEPTNEEKSTESSKILKKIGLPVLGGLLGLMVLLGGSYGYLYASTPSHIRNPEYEHYHIRTQISVDGEAIDFTASDFQEEYNSGSCNADIPELPIDFHDGEDQMTHIHWSGITGGELLKYYGWNLIGGENDSLGRRYDQGMMGMHHVDTRIGAFPDISDDTNYYIYIGDEDYYEQKDWNNFLKTDLEEFFGTKSYLNTDDSSFNILDIFSGKAYAHGGVVDQHLDPIVGEDDKDRLTRLNNLIGNLVIFAQDNEPTDEQIQAKFDNLAPLHDSTCGG